MLFYMQRSKYLYIHMITVIIKEITEIKMQVFNALYII